MSADLVEILWTSIAVVGMLVAGWGTRAACRTLRAARMSATNGARVMVAVATRRRQVLRLLTSGCFTAAGILAMTPTSQRLPILVLLLAGAAATTANGIEDEIARIRLIRYLDGDLSVLHRVRRRLGHRLNYGTRQAVIVVVGLFLLLVLATLLWSAR